MRRLRIALGACLLFTAPALVAQPLAPQPPNVRTIPPFKRPHPAATGRFPHRPNHRSQANTYPVVIDGSMMNRYLATPTPAPKHAPAPPSKHGQDVFETHSTDDAK